MSHFLYKLVAPRPTFAHDMSQEEAAIMTEHAAYWQRLLDEGPVIVFGPVLEPETTWGLAVVEAPDEEAVRALGAADPAVRSGMATFEVARMPATSVRG